MSEPQWTTKDGTKLYCWEMSPQHLSNVTRQFIRSAYIRYNHGEYGIDRPDVDTGDILIAQPIWKHMAKACEDKGVDWQQLYRDIVGEDW